MVHRSSVESQRWLHGLAPFLQDPALGPAERVQRLVIAVASLGGIPATVFYGVVTRDSSPVHSALCWLTAALFLLVYVRARTSSSRMPARAALAATIATLLAALISAQGFFSLVWVAVLPLVATFYFGRFEGLMWSLMILAAFIGVATQPHWFGVVADPVRWPGIQELLPFTFAYFLISVFAATYEVMREDAGRRAQQAIDSHLRIEARLAEFNRIGTDLLFELDSDLLVTHVSGSWAELTGLHADQTHGRHFSENAPSTAAGGWDRVLTRLQDRESVRDMPVEFESHRGDPVHLMVRANPIFDDGGRFRGYLGVAVDVTERTLAETELREKNQALQQASKMEAVGQLTSGVAHDFNNLLTVIMGNLELLEMQLEESGIEAEELAHVHAAASRAVDLTNSLLAFSRRQSLTPEYIDVQPLMSNTVALLKRTLPETIRIEYLVADDVWGCQVDRSLLENALLNLALNARDAMPGGGILGLVAENVVLDMEAAAPFEVDPGRYVSISITDSGNGIPEAVLSHVFEPFFTTKPAGEGTGLGLSMVYGFVRQTGGGIRIRSEAGAGTEIELLFPFSAQDQLAEQPIRRQTRRSGNGRGVLVVEDERAVRDLVVSMLGRLGYEARAAVNGEEALAMFDDQRPDILISDVVLAGSMTGVDVVNEVRARDAEIPALFVSGYSEAVFSEQARLPAGVALLPKPFGIADLEEHLDALFAVEPIALALPN